MIVSGINEKKRKKKSTKFVFLPGFEPWSQLFTAKTKLAVGYTENYSGQSLGRLDAEHRHF
jgi:hypothetical protein